MESNYIGYRAWFYNELIKQHNLHISYVVKQHVLPFKK